MTCNRWSEYNGKCIRLPTGQGRHPEPVFRRYPSSHVSHPGRSSRSATIRNRFIKPDDHSLRACCRHMHGLLTGLAGAKVWRRTLSDTALIREQGADIFRYAYGKAGWADVESFPDEDREFFS